MEENGNDSNKEDFSHHSIIPGLTNTPQGSLESLSEYTDAHEDTVSAPTEFLAEFLSAIMIKDYETALKYCKLILQYEPNNATAKELYPLLIEKIQLCAEETGSEDSNSERSDGTTASYSSLEDEEAELYENGNIGKYSLDQENGNETKFILATTSSEESSPTEPVSQALAQPISQLKL